jgi:hypothetical protein
MRTLGWAVVAVILGCAPSADDGVEDEVEGLSAEEIPAENTPEARGVLRAANTLGWNALRTDAKISRNAARQILSWTGGPNAPIDTIAELDGIRWVGPVTIGKLLAYAEQAGWVERSIDFCGDGVDQDGDGADRVCVSAPVAPVDVHVVTVRTTGSQSAIEVLGLVGAELPIPRGWRAPRLRVVNESLWAVEVRGNVSASLVPGGAGEWPTTVGAEQSLQTAGWGTPVVFRVVYAEPSPAAGPTVALRGTAADAHGRTLDALLELAPDVGPACGNEQAPMASLHDCVGYEACWLNVRARLRIADPTSQETVNDILLQPSRCDGTSPVSERAQLFWAADAAVPLSLSASRSGNAEAAQLQLTGDGLRLKAMPIG